MPESPFASNIRNFIARFFAFTRAFDMRLNRRWREHSNERSVFLLLIGGAIIIALYVYVVAPPREFPVGTLIAIPAGASVEEIAETLEREHVIQSALAFHLLVKIMRTDVSLHAGDYLFKQPRDLFSVSRRIATGAYGLEPIRIRIHEGATTREMARIYESHLQRFNEEAFLATAQPMEGYLFPDTYYFLPNATEKDVIKVMRDNFDTQIATLSAELEAFDKPLEEIVIMASLLEREARNMHDRRMIAGVLWRRLKIDMALQVDAAFLYSLGRTTFDLTKRDLTDASDPYNTYANKGLPPTAIGSPSLSSLRAAVTPIDEGYLFYLADSSYVTHYSRTYEEHLQKKALYIDS